MVFLILEREPPPRRVTDFQGLSPGREVGRPPGAMVVGFNAPATLGRVQICALVATKEDLAWALVRANKAVQRAGSRFPSTEF